MTSLRSRRSGSSAGVRRVPVRPLVRAASRPLPTLERLRSASRPAQRRPGRRPTRSAGSARRRPLFTGRAVLLSALVLLLALTLAGPARQWLAGRAEIARLAAERTQLDQQARDLRAQLQRQADPAYTARQARERLTYVLPGDRLIVVVDGKTTSGDPGTAPTRRATQPPWYDGLLQSVATADGAKSGSKGGK